MGQPTPGHRSDLPQVVVVEVTAQPRRSSVGGGGGGSGRGGGVTRRRVVLAVGTIAALAAIIAIWSVGGSARHRDPVAARGAAGVAAAYGYRLGCLTVTIMAADRTYARADPSHVAGCGRTAGSAPAIFHYVAGRWQLVPDAIGYICLAGALPTAVERVLDLCAGTIGPSCARIGTRGEGRPAPTLGWPCARLPDIAGVV